MKLTSIIICLITLFKLNAQEFALCKEVISRVDNPKETFFWQTIQLAWFPGSLFKAQFTETNTDYSNSPINLTSNYQPSPQNIILIFDSIAKQTTQKEEQKILNHHNQKKIMHNKLNELKIISKKRCSNSGEILNTTQECIEHEDYQSRLKRCVKLAHKLNVDYKSFVELEREIGLLKFKYTQKSTAERYAEMIKQKSITQHLSWTTVYGVDHNTIEKYITSQSIENLIIVGHSNKNHILIDTNYFPLNPRYFLKNISPTIRSISIFACNSNEVRKNYNLNIRLKNTPSIWAKRYAITVEDIDILGKGNVVSSEGFSSFFNEVNQFLSQTPKNYNDAKTETEEKECSVTISGFNPSSVASTFITLNRNYLYDYKENSSQLRIKFNCNYLNENSDNFLLVTFNMPDQSFNSSDVTVMVNYNGNKTEANEIITTTNTTSFTKMKIKI